MENRLKIFLLFLFSCTSNIQITSYPCKRELALEESKKGIDFFYQVKMVNLFSLTMDLPICEFIDEQNENREPIKTLDITTYTSNWDLLWGIIPGLSRRTVEIKGSYSANPPERKLSL